MSSSTCLGRSERAAHSAERSRTCCSDGTSPVRSSQKRPSGRGSLPPGPLGSSSWHSGICACGQPIFSWWRRADLTYGLASEADTLLRVQDGALPDERLDATGATVDLVESDLTNNLGAVVPGITSTPVPATSRIGATHLRSFLIFSISPGSFSAKVSFKVCRGSVAAKFRGRWATCLGLCGRVAAEAIEASGPSRGSGCEQRGAEACASDARYDSHG